MWLKEKLKRDINDKNKDKTLIYQIVSNEFSPF